MEIIAKLGTLLGLSFVAGINLYATVAVVGLCIKYQLVQGLPPELAPLANDAVIFVALILYAVEFLADKVPGLDTLWDGIHTLIRPFGGALLALMQVGEASPATEVIAFMLGASLASVSHFAKAGTRLMVNTSPEPFSNAIVSFGEDVGVVGLSYMSLAYPKASFFVTLTLLALMGLVLPLLFRSVKMMLLVLLDRLKNLFGGGETAAGAESPPYAFDMFFEEHKSPRENVVWAGRAYAAKVPGVPRFAPLHVVVTNENIHLLYRRWLRIQGKQLPIRDVTKNQTYPGMLLSRWLLRTPDTNCLIYLDRTRSRTLPQEASASHHDTAEPQTG